MGKAEEMAKARSWLDEIAKARSWLDEVKREAKILRDEAPHIYRRTQEQWEILIKEAEIKLRLILEEGDNDDS